MVYIGDLRYRVCVCVCVCVCVDVCTMRGDSSLYYLVYLGLISSGKSNHRRVVVKQR